MNRNFKTTSKAPASSANAIDLASLFTVATQALAANRTTLNKADTYNKNHGDNMVQTFNTITQTVAAKRKATPSQQLLAASQALAQRPMSGSTSVYQQGLAQAAKQFQGQKAVTPDNAMTLIQALFGGAQQQQSSTGADLLGSLLGGGGQQQQQGSAGADLLGSLLGGGQQQQQGSAGADLLGSLLGGGGQQQQQGSAGADLLGSLLGGGQASANAPRGDGKIDVADLLNAGMAFLQAKKGGASNLQAFIQALIANGPMGNSPHRSQSGQLVASALVQALAGMAAKK